MDNHIAFSTIVKEMGRRLAVNPPMNKTSELKFRLNHLIYWQ